MRCFCNNGAWLFNSLGVVLLVFSLLVVPGQGIFGDTGSTVSSTAECPGHAACNVSCRGRMVGSCSDTQQRCDARSDCNCGCTDDTTQDPAVCSCQ